MNWWGHLGLCWPGLMQWQCQGFADPLPHMLVIHLEGDDLGLIKGKALVLQAIEDFSKICGFSDHLISNYSISHLA